VAATLKSIDCNVALTFILHNNNNNNNNNNTDNLHEFATELHLQIAHCCRIFDIHLSKILEAGKFVELIQIYVSEIIKIYHNKVCGLTKSLRK